LLCTGRARRACAQIVRAEETAGISFAFRERQAKGEE
jgi:hypothetical protein